MYIMTKPVQRYYWLKLQENIHLYFNDEFNTVLLNLSEKYTHFLTKKIQEKINEK